MKDLKLYGPLRSGTNYLGRLMELNFKEITIHHNRNGWKHGPPVPTGDYGYLLIMKSPLAWISSMRRYSPLSDRKIFWLCAAWNRHARELFSFQWRTDALLIKYEDLLTDLEKELTAVRRFFELEKIHKVYQDEHLKMLRGGDEMKGSVAVSGMVQNRDYYKGKYYLRDFSESDLRLIHLHIDPYLITQLGYEHEYNQSVF